MKDAHETAVVVGIDGSKAATKALEWAANEAALRHVPLTIAYGGHVNDPDALTEGTARSVLRDRCEFGAELLADAIATVVEDHPRVDVTTVLREAHPADLLVELSADASVLVVGRGNASPVNRFIFGSATQRVAAHAKCPVVVVSELAAPPSAHGQLPPPVVVGVSGSTNGSLAMRLSCTEAALRGTNVVAIRAWPELNWVEGALGRSAGVTIKSLRNGEQRVLDTCVATARREHPDVAITAQLSYSPPEIALLDASADAALLVLGCRRDATGMLPRLGPLTSWLVHHSHAPIAVIGKPYAPETATKAAENTGTLINRQPATTGVQS